MKFPNPVDHRLGVEMLKITSDAQMESIGIQLYGSSDFDADYPPVKIPGDGATVWDLAYFFCMVECFSGGNHSERVMMDALANSEFIEIAELIPIECWDGKGWEDICIFEHEYLNDLARNAHYYAHKLGFITIPDGEKRFTINELNRNKRIDFSLDANSGSVDTGDIF